MKNILTALNKLSVGSIFCNLQKAFDCVNHDILLSKIEFYGVSGKADNLIKSYLQDRYQRVLVDLNSRKSLQMGVCYRWSSTSIHTRSPAFSFIY